MAAQFVIDAVGSGQATPLSHPDTHPGSLVEVEEFPDPVSPLKVEDDDVLDDDDHDNYADAEEGPSATGASVNLNMSAWRGSLPNQSEDAKRALMPPPKLLPSGPVTGQQMRHRSYVSEATTTLQDVLNDEGKVICLDGERLDINLNLLSPGEDGQPKPLDKSIRKHLLASCSDELYNDLPSSWFDNWCNLVVGMALNTEFKDCVLNVSRQSKMGGGPGFITSSCESAMETDCEQLADDMSTVDLGMQASGGHDPDTAIASGSGKSGSMKVVGHLSSATDFAQAEAQLDETELSVEDVRMANEDRKRAERIEEIRIEQDRIKAQSAALKREKTGMDHALSLRRRQERQASRKGSRVSDSDTSATESPKKPARSRRKRSETVSIPPAEIEVMDSDTEFSTSISRKKKLELKRLSRSLAESKTLAVGSGSNTPEKKPDSPPASKKPDSPSVKKVSESAKGIVKPFTSKDP